MCPVTARGTVDPVHTRRARCSIQLNGLLATLTARTAWATAPHAD